MQTCSAVSTTQPTISPAPGARAFPLTVILSDPGNTNSTVPVPPGNVSVWYTTDGSTPGVNQGTSTLCNPVPGSTGCTVTLAGPGTIKAIGQWGQGANVTSYPAGYGFVPSAATSAVYTAGAGSNPAVTIRGRVTFKGYVTPN